MDLEHYIRPLITILNAFCGGRSDNMSPSEHMEWPSLYPKGRKFFTSLQYFKDFWCPLVANMFTGWGLSRLCTSD